MFKRKPKKFEKTTVKLADPKFEHPQMVDIVMPDGSKKTINTYSEEYRQLYPKLATQISEDEYLASLPEVEVIAND